MRGFTHNACAFVLVFLVLPPVPMRHRGCLDRLTSGPFFADENDSPPYRGNCPASCGGEANRLRRISVSRLSVSHIA